VIAALLWIALQGSTPPIDDAVVLGKVEEVRTLIAGGAEVDAKGADGVTPLMRAASAGRADMVRLLLAHGASVNAKATGGVTALMMACVGGYGDAVVPLVAAKADVGAQDSQGRTALMAAASSGSMTAVDALLKAGAPVATEDASGGTALTYAAAEGNADAADALQKHGAKARTIEMILAAGRCHTPVVRSFLAGGMNVNVNDSGTTPLIVAAGGDCVETVDLLLAHGADVNARNSEGSTALTKATASDHPAVVQRLLDKGADMQIEDSLGRTAWMYATMANREEIAEMFKKARAAQAPVIAVSSPTLKNGEPIPRDHTADGHNISPALHWANVPTGVASFAVVCEDPDAGNPPPFVHWVIYNIPAKAAGLPENIPFEPNAAMPSEVAGAVQGISGFRRPFYRGPAPPSGKTHHYHFVVYALDVGDLTTGMTRADLLNAIKDHVLAKGELVATYERKP
jgi:Raf kinase inhibitor-like YbhB/YbcL family protein